jgi:predicted metal-dependent phosphoesterase TrpH
MGIQGIHEITEKVAGAIVKAVKETGLNGIAITETNNFNHGWVAGLQILDFFQKENIVILPGTELEHNGQHYLHLYIPDYYRRRMPYFKGQDWFLILAHPGFYQPLEMSQLDGIKLDAVEAHSLHGDFAAAEQISREKKIPSIKTSDAHTLKEIGQGWVEVDFMG